MANYLRLRTLSEEEAEAVRRLAASRTQAARLVQRARVICTLIDHPELSAGEAGCRAGFRSEDSGRKWVHRFNEQGLEGLDDEHRGGRPPEHDEAVKSRLISLALQKPSSLGQPFALWTLDRLQEAFLEQTGIHLATSTIWEYVEAEGLRWKRQQSWFREAERHDEQFAEKRGPSLRPTSPLRSALA